AVAAAASVAVHLIDRRHELRLHTERGRMQSTTVPGVLDGLAVTEPSTVSGLQDGIGVLANLRNWPDLVVAILGAVRPEEATALSHVGGRKTRIAMLCARAACPHPETLREAVEPLTATEWRSLAESVIDELPHLRKRASSAPLAVTGPRLPRLGLL